MSVVHDIKGKVNSKILCSFILLRNCLHEDDGIDFVCLLSIAVVSLVCDFLSNYICYMHCQTSIVS